MKKNLKFLKAKKYLVRILGAGNVADDAVSLSLNAYDCSSAKTLPYAVLTINKADTLPQIIKVLNRFNIPFLPRMSATNHCGACVPIKGGCILNMAPLDKILEVNTQEGFAIVEPGVINKHLQDELEPLGFFYAPDPASMAFTTIGGNAALNAGGPKTLKYGATLANIIKAQIVLPDGETCLLEREKDGPSLLPLLVHSEATLGIITKLWVKILPKPQKTKTVLACFKSLNDTMKAVTQIIAAGIIPCALEAMDKTTIEATKTDLPKGTQAVLIVEMDGKDLNKEKESVLYICLQNNALNTIAADDEIQKEKLWARRRNACSALSALAPAVAALDGTVPRVNLPQAIEDIRAILDKYALRAGMVFHAGDGNIHPNIILDERNLFEVSLVKKAVKEINAAVVKNGGTISGEHGVGIEKRAAMGLMYEENTIKLFKEIKKSFDPLNLSNPDKVLPVATQSATVITVNKEIENTAAKIKNAYSKKEPVIIAGLQSKFKNKKALDITALNKIIEVDAQNFTVTAQAAIPLKELEEALAKQNLFLPFPSGKGTLGGAYAAKSFDCFEDYITAIQFILPNGTIINAGGKFVKNAAGYEIIKLLHGSCGALGLITQITLRVFAEKPHKIKQKTFRFFEPDTLNTKIKNIFDKDNIFNPFIYGN